MESKTLIYEKTGKPFRTDRELVYQYQNAKDLDEWKDAAYELWSKYIRVVSIGKKQLIELAKRNGFRMYDIIEDYESIFWEKFINQLYGIQLERVAHLPNWSMYIRVMGYLQAMNRDEIKAYINWNSHTESIVESSDEKSTYVSNLDKQISKDKKNLVEDQYSKNEVQQIFWESLDELRSNLSESQKLMLNMKLKGKFNYEIQAKLKMTAVEYNQDMKVIKFLFDKLITKTAEKKGLNYNYRKICEALQ
jgi:hypothetical protein